LRRISKKMLRMPMKVALLRMLSSKSTDFYSSLSERYQSDRRRLNRL
jgi:hypothetical protein